MQCKKGEIFEYIDTKGMMRYALIMTGNERSLYSVHSAILLTEEPKGSNSVEIICRQKMYADANCVSFIYKSNIKNYVKDATREEMYNIDLAVAEALGLDPACFGTVTETEEEAYQESIAERNERIAQLEKDNAELLTKYNMLCCEKNAPKDNNIIALETERNVYKQLYEDTMKLLVSGR